MDNYYGKLARSVLMKAQADVSEAQNHLVEADAPDWMYMRLKKIMSSLRNLHDGIGATLDS